MFVCAGVNAVLCMTNLMYAENWYFDDTYKII